MPMNSPTRLPIISLASASEAAETARDVHVGRGDWPMRGWRNTVEIVLFEISDSMKPHPSIFHICTNKLRPAICFLEPTQLDYLTSCQSGHIKQRSV